MSLISVRDFSRDVSKVLKRVEAGDEIILTRDGKSIARISREEPAVDPEQRTRNLARLLELMRSGVAFGGPATYEERTGR